VKTENARVMFKGTASVRRHNIDHDHPFAKLSGARGNGREKRGNAQNVNIVLRQCNASMAVTFAPVI
jgi:hypothetical protein